MILIEDLIYGLDLKLNSLATFKNQNIPIEDKIIILNDAHIALIKSKIGLDNNYTLGLDAFKKRYEDLQTLVESFEDHKLLPAEKDKKLNKWSVDLRELKPEYMFYIDSYLVADKAQCKGRVVYINNDLAKHADIPTLLNNSNYRPSFEYEETFNTISGNELEVYTDGTFTPKEIYVSYLRYPVKVDFPGYEKMDGSGPSERVDSELPYFLKDELLNFAALLIGKPTENIPAVQFAQDSVKTAE